MRLSVWAITALFLGLHVCYVYALCRAGFRRAFPTAIELSPESLAFLWGSNRGPELPRSRLRVVPPSELDHWSQMAGGMLVGRKWVALEVAGGGGLYFVGDYLTGFTLLLTELRGASQESTQMCGARGIVELCCRPHLRLAARVVCIGGGSVVLCAAFAVVSGHGVNAWFATGLALLGVVMCWALCFRRVPGVVVLRGDTIVVHSLVLNTMSDASPAAKVGLHPQGEVGQRRSLVLTVGGARFLLTRAAYPDLDCAEAALSSWLDSRRHRTHIPKGNP